MKHKVDIFWPLLVVLNEVLVSRRPFVLRVARQHALQADAYTLDVVYGGPALSV